jgi:hypothetical protein
VQITYLSCIVLSISITDIQPIPESSNEGSIWQDFRLNPTPRSLPELKEGEQHKFMKQENEGEAKVLMDADYAPNICT